MSNYLIAIVYAPGSAGGDFKKYRWNIKDNEHYKEKFLKDMREKFPTTQHVNFYDKITGNFIEQRPKKEKQNRPPEFKPTFYDH